MRYSVCSGFENTLRIYLGEFIKIVGCLFIPLIFLTGCGPIYIPIYAPDPFSPALMDYIEVGLTKRSEIIRWLDEPDATRMDGKLMIYIEPREIERELIMGDPLVRLHYLLIELDERDVVACYEEVVNEGCTSWGVCITDRQPPFTGGGWSAEMTLIGAGDLASIKTLAKERLVVYAKQDTDLEAKRYQVSPDQCSIYIYRTDGKYGPILVGSDPKQGPQSLSTFGYMHLTPAPGPISVTFIHGREEKKIDVPCEPLGLSFIECRIEKSGFFLPRYGLLTFYEHTDQGMNHLQSRRLILE